MGNIISLFRPSLAKSAVVLLFAFAVFIMPGLIAPGPAPSCIAFYDKSGACSQQWEAYNARVAQNTAWRDSLAPAMLPLTLPPFAVGGASMLIAAALSQSEYIATAVFAVAFFCASIAYFYLLAALLEAAGRVAYSAILIPRLSNAPEMK